MKTLDLSKSVYELTQDYPELIPLMEQLGFTEITKKGMLVSVGRMMTLPKGAKMKGIPIEKVQATLRENGFETEGQPSRTEQLKGYLRRLGEGESLESVRKDFVDNFSDVDAHEIMDAEQQMMDEGTPLEEVQRLCDVHSALFHGTTSCEAHRAPEGGNQFTALMLAGIEGHPLYTFAKENEAIQAAVDKWKADREFETFARLREVSIHYNKKGDLLYTLLKVRYGVTGPHGVMWTVDDEISDEMGLLVKERDGMTDEQWLTRATAVIERIEEMIYKENNILFPICAERFSDEEWRGIYRDSKAYATCLGVENKVWADGDYSSNQPLSQSSNNEVVMPGGHLTIPQLTGLLNTIPMEISFIDADNINRFFNEGFKVFKRPEMAIDRDVFSCHPPKIEPMVHSIIDSFRSGQASRVHEWVEKDGHLMLVQYMAVRDAQGTYLGTIELDQNMDLAREYFSKNR